MTRSGQAKRFIIQVDRPGTKLDMPVGRYLFEDTGRDELPRLSFEGTKCLADHDKTSADPWDSALRPRSERMSVARDVEADFISEPLSLGSARTVILPAFRVGTVSITRNDASQASSCIFLLQQFICVHYEKACSVPPRPTTDRKLKALNVVPEGSRNMERKSI